MDIGTPLLREIEEYLLAHPVTKEHALIKHLQSLEIEPFVHFKLQHSKQLFSAHFLLKHCLYLLQDQWLKAERFLLHIDSLEIRVQPYLTPQQKQSSPSNHDKLKAYYLDIRHYFETSEDEVNQLLEGFWQRYLSQEHRAEALDTLGLPLDASEACIKRRYKELVQTHHPDKGGDSETFMRIQAAKELLALSTSKI